MTVPAGAQPGDSTLQASIASRDGFFGPRRGRTSVVEASATVTVPYSSLTAAYNNTGISDNANPAAADYDGVGDSYSAQALAAGTPTPLTPGNQVTIGGTTFTWPAAAPGTPDNVVTGGQTVALSGSGTDLGFLGASQNGTASGTVTVHYADGSGQSFNLNLADWYAGSPAVGNQILTTTSSWNFTSAAQAPHPVSIYFASVPLQQGKQVSSVTLPVLANAGGTTAMHIFAMATGTGTPTTGGAVLLSRRRLRQHRDQRQRQPGGGRLRRHRGQLLRPGAGRWHSHPTHRGRPGHVRRDHVQLAHRRRHAQRRDRRRADHRPVRGPGPTWGFLGSGGFGAASGTGTVTYTDGSTQSYSLVMAATTRTPRWQATRSPPPRRAGTSPAARRSPTR